MAPPLTSGDEGVLGLADFQSRSVVAEDALEKFKRLRAAKDESAHVRHVEQPRVTTSGQVLGDDSGGVHERHLPAGEVDHLGAESDVTIVERGPQESRHRAPPLVTSAVPSTPKSTPRERGRHG